MPYKIMLTLLAEGRVTRKQLAARYEISVRTVQRCIDVLIASGIPIEAKSGKDGGYAVDENFRFSGVLLTAEDLERIKAGLEALSSAYPDGTADEIMGKLVCVSEKRGDSLAAPRFYIDSDRWNSGGSTSFKLSAINAAVGSDRTVRITYTDRLGNCTERLLDPYTLALKEGVWYVYGMCHTHRDFRLFRLARMRSVELTDERFVRRGGDVRSALSVGLGAPMEIVLEVNDSALAKAEEWLGEENMTVRGGKFVFRTTVSNGYELVNKVLSMGTNAKVISPPELTERVRRAALKVAGMYDGGDKEGE